MLLGEVRQASTGPGAPDCAQRGSDPKTSVFRPHFGLLLAVILTNAFFPTPIVRNNAVAVKSCGIWTPEAV